MYPTNMIRVRVAEQNWYEVADMARRHKRLFEFIEKQLTIRPMTSAELQDEYNRRYVHGATSNEIAGVLNRHRDRFSVCGKTRVLRNPTHGMRTAAIFGLVE